MSESEEVLPDDDEEYREVLSDEEYRTSASQEQSRGSAATTAT